jgi:hypothetical protein
MDACGPMQLGKSQQPKHKPKTQGKTQIPRFASHHPKHSKANSERGKSPTRKTTKDLPRTQWKKPTVSQ